MPTLHKLKIYVYLWKITIVSKSPIVQRQMAVSIQKVLKQFPIVSITGPRQSGKTTLAHLVAVGFEYINFEIEQYREFAIADPLGFLEKFQAGVILDEVQLVPSLFPYIQVVTDKRKKNGEYILSGSQNFQLLHNINQSLAGRVAIYTLLPFSLKELLPYLKKKDQEWSKIAFRGFYPRLFATKHMTPNLFYNSYIKTFVEKDIHQLLNIQSARTFRQFIKLCANRCGSVFNAQDISRSIGVDNKTISRWLSLLESSYVIHLLPPYYENFDKRIIKKPKIYFYDTGLLCQLLNINNDVMLANHKMAGHIFENFIFVELIKNYLNKGINPQFYFWRDSNGNEIDLVDETDGHTSFIEIKMSKTANPDFFSILNSLKLLALKKNIMTKTKLIYNGPHSYTNSGHQIINWMELGK